MAGPTRLEYTCRGFVISKGTPAFRSNQASSKIMAIAENSPHINEKNNPCKKFNSADCLFQIIQGIGAINPKAVICRMGEMNTRTKIHIFLYLPSPITGIKSSIDHSNEIVASDIKLLISGRNRFSLVLIWSGKWAMLNLDSPFLIGSSEDCCADGEARESIHATIEILDRFHSEGIVGGGPAKAVDGFLLKAEGLVHGILRVRIHAQYPL